VTATFTRVAVTLRADLSPDVRASILALTEPRVACGGPWSPQLPHPKQAAFLTLQSREGLFGGAAGPGKSSALLMSALQYVCVPGYSALILRRSVPELEGEDGLIERSKDWLSPWVGSGQVRWSARRYRFAWPSGASLTLGHLMHENDRFRYQGLAYQSVNFDELTQWPNAKGYLYVGFSRVRRRGPVCRHCTLPLTRSSIDSPWRHGQTGCKRPDPIPESVPAECPGCHWTIADVPLRTRAASNPGGHGHSWVRARFVARKSTAARWFLPATIADNPSLDATSYIASLSELDPVERARLIRGDWDATAEGRMFNRAWFLGAA